jgi:hypothetical protein
MEQKEALALDYVKMANVAGLSDRLKDQFRITELLIKTAQLKKGLKFDENDLVPTLKWLDEKRFAESKKQPVGDDYYTYYWEQSGKNKFTVTTRNFYQQVLAPAFTKKGDTAKAALAMLKGDLNFKTLRDNSLRSVFSYQSIIYWQQCLSEKTLKQLADYKVKAKAEGLESLLVHALNQIKNDDFYELQGTSYLRAHQYARAIQCFNKLSKNHVFSTPETWEYLDNGKHLVHKLYANTFAETITDYPKKYLKKSIGLNKKTFAQKMLRLENLVKTDPKNAAVYYYQMGNGLYQTGEFGNSWFLISYDSKVFINDRRAKYNYNNDYKLALKAKEYFAKARSLSNDNTFKAKCTFMLARCAQKKALQTYDAIVWPETEDYEKQRKEQDEKYAALNVNNPYFKEFKAQYGHLPFYKTAVKECSVLRDFLKMN